MSANALFKLPELLLTTDLPIGQKSSGKARDSYDVSENERVIITTDRISAFDRVLPNGIAFKGYILNWMSGGWLRKTRHIIGNHFLTDRVGEYPEICRPYADILDGRSMLVKKARPLPIECIVRGYLSGSAWADYKKGKPVCGITLPPGLKESDKLPEDIFTPTTKAESGHDIPITFPELELLVGKITAEKLRETSLAIYKYAQEIALSVGIIIADTKMEFGKWGSGLGSGELMLIDELLTPDSSRFWPANKYEPGRAQESFDKQFVRDYLSSIGWTGESAAPELPEWVISKTTDKYLEAQGRFGYALSN